MLMKTNRKAISAAAIAAATLTAGLTACSRDSYDTGDGSLSYLRADFADLLTGSGGEASQATTDDGATLYLSPAVKESWMTAKDSVYRALVYYKSNAAANGTATVEPVTASRVIVPSVTKGNAQSALLYPTDPVALSSAWMSKNGRYLNLDIGIKTGKKDGKVETQSVGILYTGTSAGSDGTKVHRLTLLHDQNNAPEYYTVETYVSIPLYRLPFETASGDKMEITVNTYTGTQTKTFTIGTEQ